MMAVELVEQWWGSFGVFVIAVVNLMALLSGLWKLQRVASHVERTFDFFALEHEILMQDYAERHGIKLSELPTRLQRAPWWRMRAQPR